MEYGWSNFDQACKLESARAAQPKLNLAITWLNRFIEQYPGDRDLVVRAHLALAQSYERLEQYGRARITYEQWLQVYGEHPSAPYAHLRLEHCYDALFTKALITEQEHESLILDLREQLLMNYPASREAGLVQRAMTTVQEEPSAQ